MRRSVLAFRAAWLACGWVAFASAQPVSFTADSYRPATLQQLAQPRAAPGLHVIRTPFPGERREAGPETRRAVQAWIERQGLAPQLSRFMTREYRVEGTWVVFLEWADLREALKPGEPVRVYLHDIDAIGGKPLMAALFVHQGWPDDLSPLDEAILAYISRRDLVAEADQGKIAAHVGISNLALGAALASLEARGLIQRGHTGERDQPGRVIALSIAGSRARTKFLYRDIQGVSGWSGFEVRAERLLEKIQACLRAHAGQVGASGFPLKLAQLGPTGSGCLTEPETSDMGHGYRFSYFPGAPDPAGRVPIYALCAEPALVGGTGFTTFGGDEQEPGVRRSVAGEPFTRANGCASVYGGGEWRFRNVKHCLVAYAAANPAQGYPADLAPMGPDGNGCLAAAAGPRPRPQWFSPRRVIGSDDRHYEYFPGKPLGDGRIASFELRSETQFFRATVEDMMTSEGGFHAAERRTPARADPTPDVLRARITQRRRADEENMKVLDQRCAQGSMPDCGELAHREFVWQKYGRTHALWDQACAGGHDESCLFSPKYLREVEARWKKSCDLEEPLGCETLEQHRGYRVSSMSLTLKRQCEDEKEGACARLAETAAQLRNGRLLPLPKKQPVIRFAPN